MRLLKIRNAAVGLGILLILYAQSVAAQDKCSLTATMAIYSNAFIHNETGDLLGYELALQRHNDSKVDAWLYVYEGAEDDEGIHLTGQISQRHLSVQGNWTEHLVQYNPKKK